MDTQPLLQLVARARANRIKRQLEQQSAVPVLAHQDGHAPADPPRKEIGDAQPFYSSAS